MYSVQHPNKHRFANFGTNDLKVSGKCQIEDLVNIIIIIFSIDGLLLQQNTTRTPPKSNLIFSSINFCYQKYVGGSKGV